MTATVAAVKINATTLQGVIIFIPLLCVLLYETGVTNPCKKGVVHIRPDVIEMINIWDDSVVNGRLGGL